MSDLVIQLSDVQGSSIDLSGTPSFNTTAMNQAFALLQSGATGQFAQFLIGQVFAYNSHANNVVIKFHNKADGENEGDYINSTHEINVNLLRKDGTPKTAVELAYTIIHELTHAKNEDIFHDLMNTVKNKAEYTTACAELEVEAISNGAFFFRLASPNSNEHAPWGTDKLEFDDQHNLDVEASRQRILEEFRKAKDRYYLSNYESAYWGDKTGAPWDAAVDVKRWAKMVIQFGPGHSVDHATVSSFGRKYKQISETARRATKEPPLKGDPLLLDLDGDGIETTQQVQLYFDHDGDGFAESSSWVGPGDGMLVLDRNSNGVIDNGSEIFGNNTPLGLGGNAPDGFAALAELDTNRDGIVNESDASFADLKIQMGNGDLLSLPELGIASLSLDSIETNTADSHENLQLRLGSFKYSDGRLGLLADYALVRDTRYSAAVEWLEVPEDMRALPDAKGFGNVYDLHQALVRDTSGELQDLVESFVAENDPTVRDSIIDAILIKWTNSDGIDAHIVPHDGDGHLYSVLEKFLGIDSINEGTNFIGYNQVADLNEAYFYLKELVNAELMSQTHLADLIELIVPVFESENPQPFLDLSAVASTLENAIATDSEAGKELLYQFTRVFKTLAVVESSNYPDFYEQLASLGAQYQSAMDSAGAFPFDLLGTDSTDLLSGANTDQRLAGLNGNDTLDAFGGRDNLIGGRGNDRLIGGTGNDVLFGEEENDTYVFNLGDGHDYVYERSLTNVVSAGANDLIEFGEGIEANDLIFSSDGNDLLIKIAGTDDEIDVMGQLGGDPNAKIEKIILADSTEITAAEILTMLSTEGTSGNDTLTGSNYSETIDGNGGNDTIRAFGGNDVIDGGSGHDSIYAGNGESTISGGTGNDHLYTGTGVTNFVFNEGDGQDAIHEDFVTTAKEENDIVTFGDGITHDDVIFTPDGDDLIVGLRGTSDSLTLLGALDPLSKNNIEQFDFDGESSITLADAIANKLEVDLTGSGAVFRTPDRNMKVVGTDGNDIVQTTDHSSVVEAGEGDDSIVGGSGNDTIVFNLGDGQDVVISGAGTNKIVFGAGIDVEDVIFEASGADLIAKIDGTSDQITIKGQFEDNSSSQIGSFEFADESVVTWADIKEDLIIYAEDPGDTVDRSTSSDDEVVSGLSGAETITGGSGTNVLIGATGNDVVTGGSGANTYLFRRGDGDDIINEDSSAYSGSDADVLRLGEGISWNNVSFTADGNDLIVDIDGTSDSITLAGALDETADRRISFVELSDGTRVSLGQILNEEVDSGINKYIRGTSSNDDLTLDSRGGIVEAGAGNDIIQAGSGSSFIDGGTGNDTMHAGSGKTIFAIDRNSGSDIIYHPNPKAGAHQDGISFGADIDQNDILLSSDGIDLTVKIDGSSAQVLLDGALDMEVGSGARIENFTFIDGTSLSFKELVARGIDVDNSQNNATIDRTFSTFDETISLSGTNDTLRLGSGEITVDTGEGNNRVYSGYGNDTILFNTDSGYIELTTSQSKLPDAIDIVKFGAGIELDDLVVTTVGADVLISIPDTDARLRLIGAANSNSNKVSTFVFDDESSMTFEEFTSRGLIFTNSSNAIFDHSLSTFNEIIQSTTNDNIKLGSGNDIVLLESGDHFVQAQNSGGNKQIIVNGGSAELWMGSGTDTIAVNAGQITINENTTYSEDNEDVLLFGSGISPSDVIVSSAGYDMTLSVDGTDTSVTLDNALFPGSKNIAEIKFADGTSETFAELLENGINVYLPDGASTDRQFTPANEIIYTSDTSDSVQLGDNNNTVYLDEGTHVVYAGDGETTVIGGAGSTTVNAGSGNDTIVINRGEGTLLLSEDTANASGKHDHVVFGEDIEVEDVILSAVNGSNDLIIDIADSDFTTTLDKAIDPSSGIEDFTFSDEDETVLTLSELLQLGVNVDASALSVNRSFSQADENITLTGNSNTLTTGSGDNVITTGSGDHTINTGSGSSNLIGGAGNSTINTGSGSDTITINRGTGSFTVNESTNDSGKHDTVVFGEDISLEDVIFSSSASSNDLIVSIDGSSFTTTLKKGLAPGVAAVEGFSFMDEETELTLNEVWEAGIHVDASGTSNNRSFSQANEIIELTHTGGTLTAGSGNDVINPGSGQYTVNTGSGSSIINGGTGDTTIFANSGSDTFVVNRGSGVFTINENTANASGKHDYVKFASDIDTDDLYFEAAGNDIKVEIKDSDFDVLVKGQLSPTGTLIDGFQFEGGPTWTIQDVKDRGFDVLLTGGTANRTTSAYNEIIWGSSSGETILLGSHTNWVTSGAGNDTISSNAGQDTFFLKSGDGNDTINEDTANGSGIKDYVKFDAGIDESEVALFMNANGTLDIGYVGDTNKTSITHQDVSGKQIDRLILSNGSFLTSQDISAVMQQMSAYAQAHSLSFTSLNDVRNSSELMSILASAWPNNMVVGDSGNNALEGGAGNDTLDGGGGVDTLVGGTGDDTSIVDGTDDVVTENSSEGTDVIQTGITYSLDSIANVENLTLTGSSSVNATGNSLNNVLTGNSGNNSLDGGSGTDTLVGGAGDDTYVVDNTGDVITESASNGTDAVQSSVSYTLADNVENLTLTGSANINGVGNALNNVLTGNSGNNSLEGAAGHDTLTGGVGVDTLVGGTGNDVYFIDDTDTVTESSTEGTDTININTSYTLATDFENLTLGGSANVDGTGNDADNVLIGNSGVNSLSGGVGNDTVDGGSGADTMVGGIGNDAYYVDNASDVVTEASSEGTDTVNSSISYTLGSDLENLTLIGSGNIDATGNSAANVLTGNSGNNSLDGGSGADTMAGDGGNDTYIVDNTGDVVTEAASSGTDNVQASVSYTLSSDVENMTLTGSGDINATGNTLGNVLTGNSGNNSLDGGTGADSLVGGAGNDIYVVDNAGDVVTEAASEGTDTVEAGISYTLTSNVENLTLTGSGNTSGTGNSLENTITGNSGNNTLDGSTGIDTLIGGLGNDTYIVDDINDVVTEGASEGTDTVQTASSYSIAASGNVENITLTGTGNVDATANALANTLTGNSGNNVLDGGTGADTMVGGGGDDTYIVDNVGDAITEAASSGTDTIQSSVDYSIASYGDVENLTLTGSGNINATGNALANVVTGNSGNNSLNGGSGADTLVGGAGDDTYTVDNASDVVTENSSEGTDLVNASISYTLTANVENLTLAGGSSINGSGNSLNNVIAGNTGNNSLYGDSGNDTITGANGNDTLDGGSGVDSMDGGGGNDLFIVDDSSDVVVEGGGAGTDTVEASVTYILSSANVERLTLTGSGNINGTGNGLANTITGNSGNNSLDGGNGADTIIGGAGNDTLNGSFSDDNMSGGTGDDTYFVDAAADVVTENLNEGIDTVSSSATRTLSANVENLILTGSSNINGTGNTLDNAITGNTGNNSLTGDAGNDTLDGSSGNDILNGGTGIDSLIGGAGNDTYVVDDSSDVTVETSGNGTDTVQTSVSYTLSDNIENLTVTGTADLSITGNASNNNVSGNASNNTLDGDAGADTMSGGAGNDTYIVDNAGDVVTENNDEGIDTVNSSITYTLGNSLENLTLINTSQIDGTGNSADNILTGNSASNSLSGETGNDSLDGGAGADTLVGGTGNDTYAVDNASDVVTENSGEGTDTVQSSISYSLANDLENLILIGSANINATGNSVDNVLTGNSGDNVLDGGSGMDTMSGDSGNDTYVVDNAGDIVTEATSSGTDTVQSSINYTLGSNVENLTLTGTSDLNGTGNSLDNTLTGNSGNNILDGGSGTDTMSGGSGNDTYVVDNAGDVVTEATSSGTDTVQASVSYALTSNLENLTLTGTSDINGTGNDLDNVLTAGIGNNTLDGGSGADTMIGDAGSDTYIVDNSGDVITEADGNGMDYVQSSITYTLAANVEHLTLTGSADISGTGNNLDNSITGNSGNNTLDGATGTDTLAGGLGNDTYVIDGSSDVVTENANQGTDTIQANFTATLGSNIENLTLTGSSNINGTGNSLDNYITGNTGRNSLTGSSGNDTIDGGGGIDTLAGGSGNDTYIYSGSQQLVESASSGTDTIVTSVDMELSFFTNFENVTMSGTSDLTAWGNSSDNVIIGNAGNNDIRGLAGNDTLIGGQGNDYYAISSFGDVVTENDNEGDDTIQIDVSYTLPSFVENLVINSGTNITGTGNALNNSLVGNSSNNTLVGGAGNDTLDGGSGVDSLAGGTGDDLYIVDNTSDITSEASNQGTDTVQSSVTRTLSSNIENLTLTGTSNINGTGNNLNNLITGNNGTNSLNGGTGADTMIGGLGSDTYVLDDVNDVVTEYSNEGTDTIQVGWTYSLNDIANIENLTLTGSSVIDGTGTSGNNKLTGNSNNNVLSGGAGNDTVDGGSGGADTLIGGLGDDSYTWMSGDVITENADEGTDTVTVSETYTLGDNLENIIQNQQQVLHITATGNSLNNTITGNAGNNTLDGGTGTDTLIGGTGNDTFIVDDSNDVVTENASAGTDVIQTNITYSLESIANVEGLTLTGASNLNGTGNSLDNTLTGNSGNNILDGESGNDTLNGGLGDDTLSGGTGNDTFIVDSSNTVITENTNEGTDTVNSSITYTLGSNIENLVLTGGSTIHGTGNELNNYLTGNAAANSLSGGSGADTLDGGTGSDTLIGDAGDDLYYVDATGDVITETSSNGTDAVVSSVSHTLSSEVENLTLTGSSNLTGTGNASDNYLTGNSGANTLTGSSGNDTLDGGSGIDSLIGGTGNDVYYVDSTSDLVSESSGQGTDLVYSSVAYTLSANVENLTLSGSSAINGTGNTSDNYLLGNSGANSLSGSSGNDTLEGGSGSDTLAGGTGNDVYYIDSNDAVSESASSGTDTVYIDGTYTLGSNLENLILTGTGNYSGTGNTLDNTIVGNIGNNSLSGSTGNDTLDGGTGSDTLVGGTGNDVYLVDSVDDVVTENASEGTDTVNASSTYTIGSNIENLNVTGTGNFNATGSSGNNTITGNSGDNIIDGGAGVDTMVGGAGNDTYIVDNTNDIVTETSNNGTDLIQSTVSYTLSSDVENLTLTGSNNIDATGNTLANLITGNSGDNSLSGGSGDDTLDGGLGNDSLSGGAGADYYYVDAGDSITENLNEGTDTVYSGISYTLGSNIENLVLTGSSSINATGNALNNVLTGNSGTNTLSGVSGTDTLIGGQGDDTYIVDDANAIIQENSSEGTDSVTSSVNYTLSNNVENLTLTGTATSGTGNSGNNYLTGTSSNNTLDGGVGADTMYGGAGNDVFIVDNASDVVLEDSTNGIDRVESSVSYALADYDVENLTLTGTANIDGTGNAGSNVIIGNSGNNVIDGDQNQDTMIGGLGNDTYIVNSPTDEIIEYANEGIDTVITGATLTLSANVENLISTTSYATFGGNSLDNYMVAQYLNTLSGAAGNDTLIGGIGHDNLIGGTGNDSLVGGADNDTYRFDSGDGTDTIEDSNGTFDIVHFNNTIDQSDVALYLNGDNLEIGYIGSSDLITINDQAISGNAIEHFELDTGNYLTSADVNSIIQQMSSYASSNSISFTSLSDVKASAELMNIIATSWH